MSSAGSLVLAEGSAENEQVINNFFTSIPINGEIQVKIQRDEGFFSFYNRLGMPFKNYIIKNAQDEVVGTATFLIRKLKFENRNFTLAQACDLRIANNRQVIVNWTKVFHPILEKVKTEFNCDGFITTINQTESQAMNAFIRPKFRRPEQPQYYLAKNYNLASIHGFYPLVNPPNQNILVREYLTSDKPALIEFISEQLKNYDYVPAELAENVDHYITSSLLYSWNQFIIAFDSQNKIIGCVLPISSGLLQDYLPQDYSPQAHNLRQFLKATQWLQFGRKLTRPFARSRKQEALSFKLLHFFLGTHPEVYNSLIQAAYDKSTNNEFLVYTYEDNDYQKRPPKGSIHAEIPHGLYTIQQSDTEPAMELTLRNTNKIWLDYIWF